MGDIPNPDSLLVVNLGDRLTFELRVVEDPTGTLKTTVCESVGGSTFGPSEVLLTRAATPLRSCLQAFGSFSRPYAVHVRFNETITDSSVLTERKMVVVLGADCDTAAVRSGVFNVIGQWLLNGQ